MKAVAKWIAILWSIFCLIGVVIGVMNVGSSMKTTDDQLEQTGQVVGLGCGMGIWLVVWAVIALPALLVWVLTGKKAPIQERMDTQKGNVSLCKECGKYYEGRTDFCPNCGKQTY